MCVAEERCDKRPKRCSVAGYRVAEEGLGRKRLAQEDRLLADTMSLANVFGVVRLIQAHSSGSGRIVLVSRLLSATLFANLGSRNVVVVAQQMFRWLTRRR